MAANSAIEWTMRTWQLTCGCLLYSAGCVHCYAERMAARLRAMALADIAKGRDPGRKRHYIDAIGDDGRWSGQVVPIPEALDDPLGWRKPQTVFVDSMSDLFYGDERDRKACEAKGIPFTPVPFDFLDQAFATMYQAQWHTFQVLTKRAGRMLEYCTSLPDFEIRVGTVAYALARTMAPEKAAILTNEDFVRDITLPLPNVWLGVSVENQQQADRRIPDLLKTPAAVRFLSCEPLLGPIDLRPLIGPHCKCDSSSSPTPCDEYMENRRCRRTPSQIQWVIVGGESGGGARPCDPRWIRDIVHQCRAAQVPVFVKQLGSNVLTPNDEVSEWLDQCNISLDDTSAVRMQGDPVRVRLADKKGGDPAEWPEMLRVREMPEREHA